MLVLSSSLLSLLLLLLLLLLLPPPPLPEARDTKVACGSTVSAPTGSTPPYRLLQNVSPL